MATRCVAKRRRLNPESIVYHQKKSEQCIRESIETAFLDGVTMFIRNQTPWKTSRLTGTLHVPQTNVFDVNAEAWKRHRRCDQDGMTQTFVDLPIMNKAYDDTRLRPPNAHNGEHECSSGTKCECLLMAKDSAYIDDSRGFVGVVYGEAYTKCLLCIRVDTMQLFYKELLSNRILKHTIQPFENVCNKVGEYNPAMCLHPTGSNNIVAPFVKHQRQNYEYTPDGTILQKSIVNFTEATDILDKG